jgi:hypothetical protein
MASQSTVGVNEIWDKHQPTIWQHIKVRCDVPISVVGTSE